MRQVPYHATDDFDSGNREYLEISPHLSPISSLQPHTGPEAKQSILPFTSCPSPALPHVQGADPANYVSEAALSIGFLLGSTNVRHWWETGGWEEGKAQSISHPLSASSGIYFV